MRLGFILVLVLMVGFACGFESEVYYFNVGVPAVESDSEVVVVNSVSSGGGGSSSHSNVLVVNNSNVSSVSVGEVYFGDGDSGLDSGVDVVDDSEAGFVSRVTGAVVGAVGSTGGMAVAGVFVLVVLGGFVVIRVRKNSD